MVYTDNLIIPYVGIPNDATYYNNLARNIDFLFSGNTVHYEHPGSSPTSWTTNSTPNFVLVDAVFQLDITTYGLPVMVGFTGNFKRATDGNMSLDIRHQYMISGNPVPDPNDPDDVNTAGLAPLVCPSWTPLSILKPYIQLPAGTHRFGLFWRINGGSTANVVTLDGVTKPQMWVYEG